jgi:hypothetical protein
MIRKESRGGEFRTFFSKHLCSDWGWEGEIFALRFSSRWKVIEKKLISINIHESLLIALARELSTAFNPRIFIAFFSNEHEMLQTSNLPAPTSAITKTNCFIFG